MKIILGSKSPRRKEILAMMGYDFEVRVSDSSEKHIGDNPIDIVRNIAIGKANAIDISDDELLITSDTIVWFKDRILEKPKDRDDAFNMLKELQDNTHIVYTAVCIKYKNEKSSFVDEAKVTFYPLSDDEINAYIDTGDAMDKAGAYGIQGPFHKHIKSYEGDFYTIMGLPKVRLEKELKKYAL